MNESTRRVSAYARVNRAREKGDLVKPAQCSQCSDRRRVSAHHDDYDDALNVVWLCHRCHMRRHPAANRPVGIPPLAEFTEALRDSPSIVKVADRYGVSRQTIYHWIKKYDIHIERSFVMPDLPDIVA